MLVRVLLSLWVLLPGGRSCGSLRSVWGGEVCVFGGSAPASDLTVRDALHLLRHYSF